MVISVVCFVCLPVCFQNVVAFIEACLVDMSLTGTELYGLLLACGVVFDAIIK